MNTLATGDDDDFGKLMSMRPKWFLGIASLDDEWKSIGMEPFGLL